jgi:hypothetical protein
MIRIARLGRDRSLRLAGVQSSADHDRPAPTARPRVQPLAARRARERRWRESHAGELRRLQGQWVVVEGEDLIAHGPDAREVVAAARAKGVKLPYLFFVEPLPEGVLRFGL